MNTLEIFWAIDDIKTLDAVSKGILYHFLRRGFCYERPGSIAEHVGCSRMTVVRRLENLEKMGLIWQSIENRKIGYRVDPEAIYQLLHSAHTEQFAHTEHKTAHSEHSTALTEHQNALTEQPSKEYKKNTNKEYKGREETRIRATPPPPLEDDIPFKEPDPEKQKAWEYGLELVDLWCNQLCMVPPAVTDQSAHDYYIPAANLVLATDFQVKQAFDLVIEVRNEMLAKELTPRRLAAVVPSAKSKLDQFKSQKPVYEYVRPEGLREGCL